MKPHSQSGWISRTVWWCDRGTQEHARCAWNLRPDKILIFHKGFHRGLTRFDCFHSFEAFWSGVNPRQLILKWRRVPFSCFHWRAAAAKWITSWLWGWAAWSGCVPRVTPPSDSRAAASTSPDKKCAAWSFFCNKSSSVTENKAGVLGYN